MNWKNYWQIIISFSLFFLAICVFKLLGLDINFIVTFILAIFTLTISLYFFIESNKIMTTIKEKIIVIGKDIEKAWDKSEKVKDLNISRPLNKHEKRRT